MSAPSGKISRRATCARTRPRLRATREEAEHEGNLLPLFALRMGITVHQAMVDTCEQFAQRINRA